MVTWVIRSIPHRGPISCFLFQPVLHNWCNKHWYILSCLWDGAYKKNLYQLIGKGSPWSGSSQCSLSYFWCHITVNNNVLSASLNKTFPSFVVGDHLEIAKFLVSMGAVITESICMKYPEITQKLMEDSFHMNSQTKVIMFFLFLLCFFLSVFLSFCLSFFCLSFFLSFLCLFLLFLPSFFLMF